MLTRKIKTSQRKAAKAPRTQRESLQKPTFLASFALSFFAKYADTLPRA